MGVPPHTHVTRGRLIWLARFTRMTYVDKSADHQLVPPADLPTKFT